MSRPSGPVARHNPSVIYLMAQSNLLATIMPDLPVREVADFLGSTFWMV
ncbi:hypothetical protein [Spirosoma flavus]